MAIVWGYGHYLVFAAVAALGAGLEVAVVTVEDRAPVPVMVAGLAVALPVVVFLVTLTELRRLTWGRGSLNHLIVAALSILVLASGGLAGVLGLGVAVLLMGAVLSALLTLFLVQSSRATR